VVHGAASVAAGGEPVGEGATVGHILDTDEFLPERAVLVDEYAAGNRGAGSVLFDTPFLIAGRSLHRPTGSGAPTPGRFSVSNAPEEPVVSMPCAIRYTVFSVVRTEYRQAYTGERRSPHRMRGDTPERDDDGQFTARVPDEEILDAVRDLEPTGTVDVGEAVGLRRQNAGYRLRRLEEAGRLDSMKIGGALVWSVPDDSTEEGGES